MKSSIYISYAWGDNPESEEELSLQGLCKVLGEHGFEVIIDRTHLDYQQSLPEFFKLIANGGIVIPIVGKKYFYRLNCLIEASNMIIRGDVKARIFPLVLSDNYDIYDTIKRPKIITDIETFWKGKEEEIKTAIDYSNELPGSLISLREDLNVLKETIGAITPFINHIGTNKQFNFKDELRTNFKTFLEFILQKTRMEIKKPFYEKIEGEYFGREEDILFIDDFLRNEQKHFLLLFGVGGMGKTHLLSICLEKYNFKRKFFWIKAHDKFRLRNLFEECNLRFPIEIKDNKKKCKNFLNEFTSNNLFLIIDDFYEITDINVREMLSDLACLPSGKLLIISRAIPKKIENQNVYHHQIRPLEKDAFKNVMYYYISTKQKRIFTNEELDKIFEKALGYPLGGQLIIRLADLNHDIHLDDILKEIPKFEAEIDIEGKRFSERLLDNIFNKSNAEEVKLLSEFSALLGFPLMDEIRQLPSFKIKILNILVARRNFITKDPTGRYCAHTMIRDYAYENLTDKGFVHKKMGSYFESKLNDHKEIDWKISESAILHFEKAGIGELDLFGDRMYAHFRNRSVKTIIEESRKNTIRNYSNLLILYPLYLPYYTELGMAYRGNKQIDLAIETFKKAITIEHNNVIVLNELGISYRERKKEGDIDLAIATFERAIAIDPKALHSLNGLGISYRERKKEGDIDLAIETFEKAIAIDPKALHSLNELGISYRERKKEGDIDLAIKTFKKAIAIDPKALHSLNGLGISYRERNKEGDIDLAIATFEKAIAIEYNNVIVLNELGISYRERKKEGDIDLAIETFEKAIAIEPKALHSLNRLGISYRERNKEGDIDLAIETFEKAIAIDPKTLHSLNGLGICYRKRNKEGDIDLAISTFEKAIAIEPKALHSLNELGICYRERNKEGDIDIAIETFEKAIEIEPKALHSLNELGICYRERNKEGDIDIAIETFEKAVTINPEDLPSLNELGKSYRERGKAVDIDLAIETFERMNQIEPKDIASLNELGISYRTRKKQGDIDLAIETFEKAIAIDPNNFRVLNELGKSYKERNKEGDINIAITWFKKVIAIKPWDLLSLYLLGISYRERKKEGDIDIAIASFERAMTIKSNDLRVINELGISYRERKKEGDIDLAIETFEKAIAIEPKTLLSLNELGISYRERKKEGDIDLAIATFEKAIAIDPKALHSLNELGISYRERKKEGDIDLAIATFEKAIAIEHNNVRVLNELGISYREKGLNTRDKRWYSKSIIILEKAKVIEPDNFSILTELGKSYSFNNNLIEMVLNCNQAIKIAPMNMQTYTVLYKGYIHFNKYLEAIDVVKTGLKVKPTDKILLRIKQELVYSNKWRD